MCKVCVSLKRERCLSQQWKICQKVNVQNVLKPKVKLVPTANVQSSGMNSTVNSAGKESAHNQSASSVPKLVVRKNQGLV